MTKRSTTTVALAPDTAPTAPVPATTDRPDGVVLPSPISTSTLVGAMTAGIDIGDRTCEDCVLDAAGEVFERKTFATTPGTLKNRYRRLWKKGVRRVAFEIGSHSPWMSELLIELGFEVYVANAHKVQLISKSKKKTDRGDALLLARLARADPSLLSPIQHRGPQARKDLAQLRVRNGLVSARTKLINLVRGSVKPWGARVPKCSADCFHERAREALPKELAKTLASTLRMIGELTEAIAEHGKQIEALSAKSYPETQLLRQVKGVGPITALTFVLTIERPDRIHKARNVAAYLGLVPAKSQTGGVGGRDPELGITKAGDRMLRSLLVSAAQYILGPFGDDCDLRRYGQRIEAKGSKAAKKRAVVAVARKLSVLLLRLWQTGEVYDPMRNSDVGGDGDANGEGGAAPAEDAATGTGKVVTS